MDINTKIEEKSRLYCSGQSRKTMRLIDATNFLNIGGAGNRTQLYLFALALGLSKGPSDLENRESLVRYESLAEKAKTIFYTLFIAKNELKDNEFDILEDTKQVLALADKYANTGFKILDKKLNETDQITSEVQERLALDLLVDLQRESKKIQQCSK
jgi:hypothetical protein